MSDIVEQDHEALVALSEAIDIFSAAQTIAGHVVVNPAVVARWLIKHTKPLRRALAHPQGPDQ